MANLVFPRFQDFILRSGGLDSIDLRCLLVAIGTTVPTEPDVEFLDEFVDLMETDAAGYARQDLGSVALTYQAGTLRSELTSAAAAFGALSPGVLGLPLAGALWFAQLGGGTEAENRPIEWMDTPALGGPVFPYELTGAVVSVTPASSGWLRYLSAGASSSA